VRFTSTLLAALVLRLGLANHVEGQLRSRGRRAGGHAGAAQERAPVHRLCQCALQPPGEARLRRGSGRICPVDFLVNSMAGSSDLRGAVVVVDVLARLVAARGTLVFAVRIRLDRRGFRGDDRGGGSRSAGAYS
jgi:hypothetical protein